MSKVKVTFRKEVEIDLNEYYQNFPPKLRREIDDTVYAMLGGQSPKHRPSKRGLSVGVKGAIILKRTDKQPVRRNSKEAAVLSTLDHMNGKEHLVEDIINLCEQHKLDKRSAVHNLVSGGYLEVIK